jgi:hypothetical protein
VALSDARLPYENPSGRPVTLQFIMSPSCPAALDPERYNPANLFYDAVGDEPAGKVTEAAAARAEHSGVLG